ncbi:MAG: hypothetical protein K2N87_06165 [Eubacterium sp.]|nr:hypothetical protein [Eubacterium sp.]
MSTLENTVAMMRTLPESDLLEIQSLTLKLFNSRRAVCPFPLKSRQEIYKDLENSRKQATAGEYQEMGEAVDEICLELGI